MQDSYTVSDVCMMPDGVGSLSYFSATLRDCSVLNHVLRGMEEDGRNVDLPAKAQSCFFVKSS